MPPTTPQPLVDPEDLFADTRMSFGDHIEELRTHLIRAMVGFVAALVICLCPPIGPWALKFITAPVENQLTEYYRNHERNRPPATASQKQNVPMLELDWQVYLPALKDALAGKKDLKVLESLPQAVDQLIRGVDMDPDASSRDNDPNWVPIPVRMIDPSPLNRALRIVDAETRQRNLIVMNVQEAFVVYVKVCMLLGFIVASPWTFYQIWSFIAAGLYPQEKKLVNHYLPVSLGLFLGGCALCQFLALPKAIESLLWFNEWLGFDPELRLSEWLGFAVALPMVFGLSFQTPIVMLLMFKMGLVTIETFQQKRRMCVFVMGIIAALITPSTDPGTMLILWVPMYLLFEIGIVICKMQPPSPIDELDNSELDEMVGV